MNSNRLNHRDYQTNNLAKKTEFIVAVIPQIGPFDFGDEAINFGDSTSLTCSVHKGDLPIKFSWMHNNISVGYINGIGVSKVGKKNSVLTIDSVIDKHSGIYTCVAENEAGIVSYSALLNVNGTVIFYIVSFPFSSHPIYP